MYVTIDVSAVLGPTCTSWLLWQAPTLTPWAKCRTVVMVAGRRAVALASTFAVNERPPPDVMLKRDSGEQGGFAVPGGVFGLSSPRPSSVRQSDGQ